MFGALPKLWPFDRRVEVDGMVDAKPIYYPTMPSAFDHRVLGVVLMVITAAALVFVVDRLARRQKVGTNPGGESQLAT